MVKKSWLVAISLALVIAIVGLAGCGPGNIALGEIGELNISSQQEGIWVTGQGKVSVVPDIVSLRLGIEAQAATVAEAQAQAAEAMNEVMDALADNGIAEKDIQTQYYNIYPVRRWDNGKETLIGYRVTNMVTVKIREVADTGAIIDAVVSAGGDYIRINSIGFSIDDPSAYYEEAREKAMADAKAKAEQLAELAGVTLGKPTYISEGGIQVPYPRVMMETAMAAPAPETPISPGEMEVSLTVQVVYAIL